MRRIVLLLCLASTVTVSVAQTWDKPIAPGLLYRMETDLSGPRNIHALRWNPSLGAVQAVPSLGNGTVFSEDVSKSRATVGAMVAQNNALAGINADFFPWTGDPLGLMVKQDELWSLPYPKRSFCAWGPLSFRTGIGSHSGSVHVDGQTIPINGVNQECGPGELVVFTEVAGFARSKDAARVLVIEPENRKLKPTGKTRARVLQVLTDIKVRAVPSSQWLIVASGKAAGALAGVAKGETLVVEVSTQGYDEAVFDYAVAGGPNLISGGKIVIDAVEQGFGEKFSTTRHPRTAVGVTPAGEVWWIVIDGRQDLSVGASLQEMAQVMLKYGCAEAINLDGGGSSCLFINGVAVNRPSDGMEREVANGVVFIGSQAAPQSGGLTLALPKTATVGEVLPLSLRLDGVPLPQIEVLWTAMGGAWIDQGGQLIAVKKGAATIRASARGRIVEQTIEIQEKL